MFVNVILKKKEYLVDVIRKFLIVFYKFLVDIIFIIFFNLIFVDMLLVVLFFFNFSYDFFFWGEGYFYIFECFECIILWKV